MSLPPELRELMAQLNGLELETLDKPFIKLNEPCSGTGAMVLAFVKRILAAGHNPAYKLWVHCIDFDSRASRTVNFWFSSQNNIRTRSLSGI